MTAGVPYTFTPGQTPIDPNQVNADFQALVTYINGLSIPTTPVSIANGGTGSSTAAAALTALGLAKGTIIPGTATYTPSGGNGTLTFTGAAASPTVSAYGLGNFYAFMVPSSQTMTNLYFVDATTGGSGLAALQVYDNPGFSPTGTISANQFCILAYEPAASTFVLLNPPATISTSRSASFLATGTGTLSGSWVCPPGVTQVDVTACAPGGGGGGCMGNAEAGGGGGGGGGGVFKSRCAVTAGGTYAVNIGAAGLGGVGTLTASAGGTLTFVSSSFSTLVSASGGGLGGSSTGTAATSGGGGGTAFTLGTGSPISGSNGVGGIYASGAGLTFPGVGGGSCLGAGGPAEQSIGNGLTPSQWGGGGSGSGPAGGSAGTGGNGAPGRLTLEW